MDIKPKGVTALALVVLLVVLTAPVLVAPPGYAVPREDDDAFPSREEIAEARQRVQQKTRDVGEIKAALVMANSRLEAAAVEAAQASEAYNGAMWRLEQAREELVTAREEAAEARREVDEQRDAIGALVAETYRRAGQLTAVNAMMSADGPESVLSQYATFQGASSSLQADYDRFAATDAMAQVFEKRARKASAKAERLATEARAAKEAATQAAARAQAEASRIADEKDRLIRELARAQDISVSLARQRQAALEEIARQRAAERARREAEEAAQAEAARRAARRADRKAAQRAEARRNARNRARQEVRGSSGATHRRSQNGGDHRNNRRDRTSTPVSTPSPRPASPQPVSAPPPSRPPSGSGGAQRAISFARAQLGEPYVWGAAGPSSWDCSGLTMAAWRQAGVSLPHYSVAQYYAGTPISAGSLRPGDLVFWGSSSDPGSIFHVALYIGGGQIIHAPRTGRPVTVESMYYWTPPNFFARV